MGSDTYIPFDSIDELTDALETLAEGKFYYAQVIRDSSAVLLTTANVTGWIKVLKLCYTISNQSDSRSFDVVLSAPGTNEKTVMQVKR